MTDLKKVEQLVTEKKKVQAIKRYREQMGIGLKEAKEAVEHFELTGSWTVSPKMSISDMKETMETLICDGKIIGAIKFYREQTGKSLPEAKDFVENLDIYKERQQNNPEETSSIQKEDQNTNRDPEDSYLRQLNEQSIKSTSPKNAFSNIGLFVGVLLFLILGIAGFLFSSGNF